MINLRYHIVSITAVFLALGIGIFMGSSFLGRAAYDQVQKNVDSAERRISDTRDENGRLRAQLDELQSREDWMVDEGAQRLFADDLAGSRVLAFALEGADEGSTDRLLAALESSQARYQGLVTFTSKLALADGGDAEQLAEVLGVTTTDPEAVRARLTATLARALEAAAAPADPGGSQPDASQPLVDLLTRLQEAGFVDYKAPAAGGDLAQVVTGSDHRYALVSGPGAEVPDEALLRPLLVALTDRGPAPVVVVTSAKGDGADEQRSSVIGPIRSDDQMASRLSTVDDLELFEGIAATIEALEDIDLGVRGHYGVGEGASALLPEPVGS